MSTKLYGNIREKLISSYAGIGLLNIWRTSGMMHLLHLIKGNGGLKATENPEFGKFIEEHKIEIDKVTSWLEDERSKEVYRGIINYKITGEYRYLRKIMDFPQYFMKDIVKPSENEVFVDCGGYIGDSVIGFIRFVRKKYDSIYMWEPDPANIRRAEIILKKWKNITIVPYGLYSRKTEFNFIASGKEGSSISNDGNISISCDSIDNLLGDKSVSFIKMDIEGAEIEALKGAEKTIKKNRPKLAISIYHRPEDLYEIPELIRSYVPDYRLYVRHHSDGQYDTVLYAVM